MCPVFIWTGIGGGCRPNALNMLVNPTTTMQKDSAEAELSRSLAMFQIMIISVAHEASPSVLLRGHHGMLSQRNPCDYRFAYSK